MTKTWTIWSVNIYASIKLIIYQFMKLHTAIYSIKTQYLILQHRRTKADHTRNIWNWKGIDHVPYQVFVLKNHWRLIKVFILNNHQETRTWSYWIGAVLCSLYWEKRWYYIPPCLLDCTNKPMLEEVDEHWNSTRGIVIRAIAQ